MSEIVKSDSSISKVSELDFGAVRHDIDDPAQVERLRTDLQQENPLVAKLLLSEAEQVAGGTDSVSQAFMKGGLTMYDLIRRQEEDLRLREVLGFNALNNEPSQNDIITP